MLNPLVALFAWPFVVMVLFNKYRLPLALLIGMFAGYLLLPERTEINLPLVPALNKYSIPALACLLMSLVVMSRKQALSMLPNWFPGHWLARVLMLMLVIGAFMTVVTNRDGLLYGLKYLRPMRFYDAFSFVLTAMISLVPFILARKFLAHPREQRIILIVFCVSGLLYSLLALFEIRMSPQLHIKLYGFFQHSFLQHFRSGGFRPIVFLNHGIWVALFLCFSILATVGLLKMEQKVSRGRLIGAAVWMLVTLVFCKSLGALAITLILAPIILFFNVRMQLLVAGALAIVLLTYPMARGAGLIPVDRVISIANSINPARAQSLQWRLTNEDTMLEKAQQRMIFGWGGWGRSRVVNDKGEDITTADGRWIILLGVNGWVGYLAEFGLLTAPLVLLAFRREKYKIEKQTAVLALIMSANLIDMLPNSTLTPLTWLLAGSLWGRLELGKVEVEDSETSAERPMDRARPKGRHDEDTPLEPVAENTKGNVYTRQRNRIHRRGCSTTK